MGQVSAGILAPVSASQLVKMSFYKRSPTFHFAPERVSATALHPVTWREMNPLMASAMPASLRPAALCPGGGLGGSLPQLDTFLCIFVGRTLRTN